MDTATELQAWYKDFDAAVERLPPELRKKADLFRAKQDRRSGTITFDDRWGKPFAFVSEDGRVTYPQKEVQAPIKKEAPRPAGMTPDQRKLLLLCAKKVNAVDETLATVIDKFADRLESIEQAQVHKSLDAEAYGAMTEMAERVESLEATLRQIADGAIRYRGYWQEGELAQKGDAFSHNGSTYRANAETETEPGTAGGTWTTLARGAPRGTR